MAARETEHWPATRLRETRRMPRHVYKYERRVVLACQHPAKGRRRSGASQSIRAGSGGRRRSGSGPARVSLARVLVCTTKIPPPNVIAWCPFSLGVRSRVSNVRGDIAARTPAGPSGRHMHTAPPCTVQISRRADAQEELEEVDTCTRDTSTCSRARRIGKRPTTANFRVMDACNVIGCGPGIDCRCHRPRPKPRSARTECTTSSAARSAQCAPSAARRPMSLARPRAALRASGPARCPRAVARKPARRAAARCAARREAQVREIASSPGGLGRGASRRPAATRTTQTHADQYIPSHEAPRARGGHTAAVGAPARRAPPLLLRAADARKRRSTQRGAAPRRRPAMASV